MDKKLQTYGPICHEEVANLFPNEFSSVIPDTWEIVSYLNDFVIGQEDVKKALAVAAVRHLYTVNFNMEIKERKTPFGDRPSIYNYISAYADLDYNYPLKKQNLMVIGPSGTGKTLAISKLAEFLDIPYYVADATSLTAAGYVGESVDSILAGLIKKCDMNVDNAEKGLIFIDEVDKIISSPGDGRRDVGGTEVQHALLKLVEGGTVSVSIRENGLGHQGQDGSIPVNTDNILFVFGGAFTNLRESLNKKSEKAPIGFGTEPKNKFLKITTKDLIDGGMTTEFMGRIGAVVETKPLKDKELIQIMTEPKDSLIRQYRTLFQLMGREWDYRGEKKLIKRVVERAKATKTGARGLATILEEELREKLYNG